MRLVVGILFWLLLLVAMVVLSVRQYRSSEANADVVTFLTRVRQRVEIDFAKSTVLRVGDPVVIFDGEYSRIIGNVVDVSKQNPTSDLVRTKWAAIEFYSSVEDICNDDELTYHQTPQSMEWVVQMMLPQSKRQEIAELIADVYRRHHAEIADALQPIILKSIQEASVVVREEFYESIRRHENEIQELGRRYQSELVDQKLLPLIKTEIWPIVQKETTPIATKIGEQIWEKASVWRFGWRMLYDKSPLPERNLVNQEFERFMNQHGIPVIESQLPEIMSAQQRVLQKASQNEVVQEVVSQSTMKVLRDPEFQQLTATILREVFVDNKELIEVFERNWNTDEARAAIDFTNERIDPTITKIGRALFGSPEDSITPEFSRILRNRILFKDDRWLVLERSELGSEKIRPGEVISVRTGQTGIENPFHVPARSMF
ncbi:MAG: hypothetical protein AAGA30_19040 [Planctomycetota bacterium]